MEKNEQTLDDIEKQDAAFIQSGESRLSFGGGASCNDPVTLEPFDTYRQTAAQKCGMLFLNMDDDAVELFQERRTYDGILWDAVLVLFLMISPRSVSLRALRDPKHVCSLAAKWQADSKISLGSNRHAETLGRYADTITAILDSAAEVDQTGTEGGGETLGKH